MTSSAPDRGRTLYEEWRAAMPRYVPNLVPLARRVHWVTKYLADSENEATEMAVLRAWERVMPPSPQELARLGIVADEEPVVRGIPLGMADFATLEFFVQQVLRYLAEELRTRQRRWNGIHPSQGRFAPDRALLASHDGVSPYDRVRNQLTDANGKVISDIRFYAPDVDQTGPDANQLRLALSDAADQAPAPARNTAPKPPKRLTPEQERKKEAVKQMLQRGDNPPVTVRWGAFITELMTICKVPSNAPGFGPKQIRRLVHAVKSELNTPKT